MLDVQFSKAVKKGLNKLPKPVVSKLGLWVDQIERFGLEEVRKRPGFHDEPLKGKRKGQRSIRLSRSYRAIYTLTAKERIEFVLVEEVNNHDY